MSYKLILMAKKEARPINVANPKVGKEYEFLFGGFSQRVGVLASVNEDLTKHYGYKWYSFHVPADPADAKKLNRAYWIYPCSIFDIIKEA